ncbi:uncharacterized protein LOC142632748 [Castanea sativa]|uniref:uncharacterized protein LOC142632748 n=1 Tax=Castanea sativa TaxID=21020 RepID=UPI003F6510FD
MFTPTLEVLQNIIDDAIDGEHQAEIKLAYDGLTSFEFVFIVHLEKETMEITDKLCQALQSQSQDILNAMHLVSSIEALIQKFRDDGWDGLLTTLISFCEKHSINVPNMNARYVARRGRARNQQDNITIEHYYRVNIFYSAIDSQLQELNHQFNEDAMELLRLSSALEPRKALKSFRSSDLCLLASIHALKICYNGLKHHTTTQRRGSRGGWKERGWRSHRLGPWPLWSKLGLASSNRCRTNGTHDGKEMRIRDRDRKMKNDPHDS